MSLLPSRRLLPAILASLLLAACAGAPPAPESASGPLAHIRVPAGYELEVAAGPDLVDYPMFATLDETGRLFVFESIGNVYKNSQQAIDTPQFRITLLQDTDADGRYDQRTVFADSLSFPQGGVFYQGSLYASSAPDLLKLTDTDGDGVADRREVLLSGWVLNVNANSLVGPFMGPDGWLYLTSAIMGFDVTSREGQQLKGRTARIWRLRPDGSGLEWLAAGGMNNPVELAFSPAAEVIGTQTFFVDPQRGLRDALTYWTEGGIYGKKHSNIARDGLALTGELLPVVAQYSRVAPAGIGSYRNTALGEDFHNNLFSAQFNTHRVMRHKLLRAGASFRTEDEVFLESANEDFHPTDVLEDADGSLLVVETGGWFILGCPLSQVSKPQLKGSIYRIRRSGAAAVKDPYGNAIDWKSAAAGELAAWLADPRPFVRDRAAQALTERGAAAVPALARVLQSAASADARTAAVFALSRIGTADALAALRSGLRDAHEQVRIAAARMAGMARDAGAFEALVGLLQDESLAVRRQAATALGQLGDAGAIVPLLEAAAGTDDRFVSHALIHSLFSLNQADPLAQGLDHASPAVRKAALIALDQSRPSPLKAAQIQPFLESDDRSLQETALWVAAHHPDWAAPMIAYWEQRLAQETLPPEAQALLGEIMTSFCGHADMQRFMAKKLAGSDPDFKRFLLKSMASCQEKDFPGAWIPALAAELGKGKNPDVKSAVVALARLRRIKALAKPLAQEAGDGQNDATLRVQAIASLASFQPATITSYFSYLFDLLMTTKEASLRQQVALTLADAPLSEDQRAQVAGAYLPVADPFILPRLLPVFQGATRLETGQALVQALSGSPVLDHFTEEQLRAVFAAYPAAIQPDVDRLAGQLNAARGERLARIRQLEGNIAQGDEARGRALYFGKATCWTCHTLGEEGGNLGPDLTSIQKDRSPHDILEAILYPGVSFVREYETYEISTRSQKYLGIIQEQSPEAIVLGLGPQAAVRIAREEIVDMQLKNISLMPQGLGELLSEQELVDLVAFLLGNDLVY